MSRDEPGVATWRPLLAGEVAAAAKAALAEIAAALRPAAGASESCGALPRTVTEPDLVHGQAGLALFFAYLHRLEPEAGHEAAAEACLDRAAEGIGEASSPSSLYLGFPGVAWTVEHLWGPFVGEGEDPLLEIDAALAGHLGRSRWSGDYDLISGLVGLGVYALARLPGEAARAGLEAVVRHLAELAEEQPAGITWKTGPERILPRFRADSPDGNYNLGVAHGVPGPIALLAAACAAGAGGGESRRLLDGAVAWLLAQRLPPGSGAAFAFTTQAGKVPTPARLAWCYGDLGIAAALLAAARSVGEARWEAEARRLAAGAARRDPASAGVLDAGLCHGAAGVAHLFNRLFQATGDEVLAGAARSWFGRALTLRRPGEGSCGFFSFDSQAAAGEEWVDEPGLLSGAAGIGLALSAALGGTEPRWDRLLLASPLVDFAGSRQSS